jgi:hypothetical protein
VKRRQFLVGGMALLVFRRVGADTAVRVSQDPAKKTLVLIIPAAEDQRDSRGHVLGAFLNHASDAQLAPLAGVEVVCAPQPPLPTVPEPLLALYGRDGSIRWASAQGLPPIKWNSDDDASASIEKQIDFVAMRVRELMGAPAGNVKQLAASVRERLLVKAPPGAHWARDSSCGFDEVEGMSDPEADNKISMDCGMGHVPDKSARFLYFWNKTPARRALDRNGG